MPREAVLDLLEGAARYLDDLADASGARVCPEHGVEHLGKSAYRIHLGLALAGERDSDLAVVRETALHLARRCRKYPHPDARAYLFFERWPDKWNCSNHLIDSGAACDALGRALIEAPQLFDDEQRGELERALGSCAETYLWAASIDKPVPAQCLWGALGMARAARALDRDDLREQVMLALEHAYRVLRTDGSWGYYGTGGEVCGGEAGSEDASAFYHSRCVGFALEALELIGEDPASEPHREHLTRALDFLLALHRRDGTKCRAWEAKLWYFDGPVETASCSFDVHALLLGYRAYSDERYRARAARSLELLLAARKPNGSIGSGAPRAFQCPTFWTAHIGLLGTVLPELSELDSAGAEAEAPRSRSFEEAGLVLLEDSTRRVLLRTRRPAPSPGFGGFGGGGSIVSDSTEAAGERVTYSTLTAVRTGEFVLPTGLWPLSFEGRRWKTALTWLRFSRWRWRTECRAAGLASAVGLASRTLAEVLAWCRTEAASHFACRAEVELEGARALVRSELAKVDGGPIEGTRTERCFALAEGGLAVHELLTSEQPLPLVRYRLPETAKDIRVNGEAQSSRPRSQQLCEARGVKRMEVEYRLDP